MTKEEREMLLAAFAQSIATNQMLLGALFSLANKGTLTADQAQFLFDRTLGSMEKHAEEAAALGALGESAWTEARALAEKQLGLVIEAARTPSA